MNHQARLLMRECVTHDVQRFILTKPDRFDFEPGHAVELAIDTPAWREEGRPFTPTSLRQDGGYLVLIANSPQGQVIHYMMGPWGETIVGSRFRIRFPVPANINHLIIYTEYPELAGLGFLGEPEKVMMMSDWNDVVRTLREFHGDRAEVAVYPSGDIPCFG